MKKLLVITIMSFGISAFGAASDSGNGGVRCTPSCSGSKPYCIGANKCGDEFDVEALAKGGIISTKPTSSKPTPIQIKRPSKKSSTF